MPPLKHKKATVQLPNSDHKVCACCHGGLQASHVCVVRHPGSTDKDVTVECFLQHHNPLFCGLTRDDAKLVDKQMKDFNVHTEDKTRDHCAAVKRLCVDLPNVSPSRQLTAAKTGMVNTSNRQALHNSTLTTTTQFEFENETKVIWLLSGVSSSAHFWWEFFSGWHSAFSKTASAQSVLVLRQKMVTANSVASAVTEQTVRVKLDQSHVDAVMLSR